MENKPRFTPDPQLRLMDQVRQVLRYHHYAYRTEQTYCDWILRYIRFYGGQTHPIDMRKIEVEAFLSHLAVQGQVSAATQKQAFNAIIFLYRQVLDQPIDGTIEAVRAKVRPRMPVVMTREEVIRILDQMSGTHQLMAKLMYGGGLRLMECVRFRVQDLDIERGLVCVRAAKGDKDSTTLLPVSVHDDLRRHIERVKVLHQGDLDQVSGKSIYPPPLPENTPRPPGSSVGNMSSHPRA
jgi:site-specific recombinase XerD